MKKTFLRLLTTCLLSLGLICVPEPASATIVALSAVTTNVSSTAYAVMNAGAVYVQIYSTGSSQASVTIDQSINSTGPWTTAATISNPNATGEMWAGPGGGWVRITVGGYVSGTITASVAAVRNEQTIL